MQGTADVRWWSPSLERQTNWPRVFVAPRTLHKPPSSRRPSWFPLSFAIPIESRLRTIRYSSRINWFAGQNAFGQLDMDLLQSSSAPCLLCAHACPCCQSSRLLVRNVCLLDCSQLRCVYFCFCHALWPSSLCGLWKLKDHDHRPASTRGRYR